MIDRRSFVQSMIAFGAAASLRPAGSLFAFEAVELRDLADAALDAARMHDLERVGTEFLRAGQEGRRVVRLREAVGVHDDLLAFFDAAEPEVLVHEVRELDDGETFLAGDRSGLRRHRTLSE